MNGKARVPEPWIQLGDANGRGDAGAVLGALVGTRPADGVTYEYTDGSPEVPLTSWGSLRTVLEALGTAEERTAVIVRSAQHPGVHVVVLGSWRHSTLAVSLFTQAPGRYAPVESRVLTGPPTTTTRLWLGRVPDDPTDDDESPGLDATGVPREAVLDQDSALAAVVQLLANLEKGPGR